MSDEFGPNPIEKNGGQKITALDRLTNLNAAVAGLVSAIILSILALFVQNSTVIVICVSCIASLVIALYFENLNLPQSIRNLRKIFHLASKNSEKNFILKVRFDSVIKELSTNLEDISKGRFTFQVSEVSPISVIAMNSVTKDCTLLFPVYSDTDILLHESKLAIQYSNSVIKTSARIKPINGRGVQRIFIVDRNFTIESNLFEFMKRDYTSGIDVRFIYKEDIPSRSIHVEYEDFGCYETDKDKWVMIIKKSNISNATDYIIETEKEKVKAYFDFASSISKMSGSYEDFVNQVVEPVNAALWPTYFAKYGFEMHPPHGLSAEDAGYIELQSKSIVPKDKKDILIFGMTPKLLKIFDKNELSVTSVDLNPSKPTGYTSRCSFVTRNWLDLTLDKKFDFMCFDEAINNLSTLQLPMFFDAVKRHIKDDGLITGRVLGRFDDEVCRKYYDLNEKEIIGIIESIDGNSHTDFASAIICLMHSRNICLDDKKDFLVSSRWNAFLDDMRLRKLITEKQFKMLRLEFEFRIYTPNEDYIFEKARKSGLATRYIAPASGPYIEKYPDAGGFYRMITFELSKN